MKKEPLKILFIGPHRPNRNPSQRFRMEQYFPYLAAQRFAFDYSWFIDEGDDRIMYSRGNTVGKFFLFMKAIVTRLGDVLKANRYDFIFVQREAFMTGSVFFEKRFSKSKAKLVFDFDDAIWLPDTSSANEKLAWLKRPSKTNDIIAISDLVIAGNPYLANHARAFNKNVVMIPTVVDTSVYKPMPKNHAAVCIGWTGSSSTLRHFQILIPVLKQLKEHYGNAVRFCAISDKNDKLKEEWIEHIGWEINTEVALLHEFDIGIMPLPDDDWSKGKCGLKVIQYLSLGFPAVASPVGINPQLVLPAKNGYLASTDQEWFDALSKLIESPALRDQYGKSGRLLIEENYSVASQLPRLLSSLRALVS